MIFSAAELTRLHATHDRAKADTCRIRAAVETVDAITGQRHTWPAVTSTKACAVLDRTGVVAASGEIDLTLLEPTRTVVLPRGTAINRADRIEWKGVTLEVVDTRPTGTYGPAVYAETVEVTP